MKKFLPISISLLTAQFSSAQSVEETVVLQQQFRFDPQPKLRLIVEGRQEEQITIRGCREAYYYIDGIKVYGDENFHTPFIEEVNIITGGIPMDYGDINSSIISTGK